jgi:hypothetical protein
VSTCGLRERQWRLDVRGSDRPDVVRLWHVHLYSGVATQRLDSNVVLGLFTGHRPRTVYLQPEGLPEGMRLTVSPPQQVVPPRSTVIFNCRLELDDRVIAANCRSDSEFTILAWRMTEETSVRWGGVQYRIRPRRKTTTTVSGGWFAGDASVSGRVDPDPGGGEVRLRINFNNVKARWQTLPLGAGGTFKLDLTPPAGALQLDVEAAYRGSRYFGPSKSTPLTIYPYVVK